MFWHMVANQLLTLMTNVLYNSILSDMETGYKVFRREVIQSIPLRAAASTSNPRSRPNCSSGTFASSKFRSPSTPASIPKGRRSG